MFDYISYITCLCEISKFR